MYVNVDRSISFATVPFVYKVGHFYVLIMNTFKTHNITLTVFKAIFQLIINWY